MTSQNPPEYKPSAREQLAQAAPDGEAAFSSSDEDSDVAAPHMHEHERDHDDDIHPPKFNREHHAHLDLQEREERITPIESDLPPLNTFVSEASTIGTISGKVTTIMFDVLLSKTVDKFEFVRAKHPTLGVVLSQIDEIELGAQNLAHCRVIGVLDPEKRVSPLRNPLLPETPVFIAENALVQEFFHLEKSDNGAFIGRLSKRNIPIYLDLNKLLTKHVAVLAKSGAGKSYSVGVLLEEILEHKVPLLIIDPHGEYITLSSANDSEKDISRMESFGIKPKAYKNVREFANTTLRPNAHPIALPATMTKEDLIHSMPKLSSNQLGLLYNALKLTPQVTFESVRRQLDLEESPSKWSLIPILDYLMQLGIFSSTPVAYNELISQGCSIMNLKGFNPDVQEIIVWKLCSDLFQLRKEGKIPPFFLVVEEAHNFCPERSFGETKCSKILRDIASEGRKFGLGLCIISQRPARIDKSVLSQCTTNIILKITNPNDLKTISSSVEGISSSSESEIQALPIGSALVAGVVDIPLFVTIRPRKSLHGGTAVDMIASAQEGKSFFEKFDEFDTKNLVPIIGLPSLESAGAKERRDTLVKNATLLPCYLFVCKDKDGEYGLLVEMHEGRIVVLSAQQSIPLFKRIPALELLLKKELHLLQNAFSLGSFTPEELIKKLGMNLTITEELNTLVRKGYLSKVKEQKQYKINEEFMWESFIHARCDATIELVDAPARPALDSGFTLDEMKEKLSKFTDVVDQRACFVLLPQTSSAGNSRAESSGARKRSS